MIEIWTDGAASNNGKENAIGGWAYVIVKDGEIIARESGGEIGATNQRMELTAALKACEAAEKINPLATVKLYSDSAYFIRCFKENWWKNWCTNGWKNSKKEPVANQDLWKKLVFFFMKAPRYDFIKVKGHANNNTTEAYWNDIVDKMAVQAKFSIM